MGILKRNFSSEGATLMAAEFHKTMPKRLNGFVNLRNREMQMHKRT